MLREFQGPQDIGLLANVSEELFGEDTLVQIEGFQEDYLVICRRVNDPLDRPAYAIPVEYIKVFDNKDDRQ